MFLLIQLIILFCSFAQAEYVLYKYDGTELSVQEHRQAYQILLEQQWPTAPAFNSNYNPEIDEEVEIAKRLKAEVPTVYAQWIPRIVYEFIAASAIITSQLTVSKEPVIGNGAFLADFISPEKTPDFYDKSSQDFLITSAKIAEHNEKVNLYPHFLQLHRAINEALCSVFKKHPIQNEQLVDYYYKILLGVQVGCNKIDLVFNSLGQGFQYFEDVVLKIISLELSFKKRPDSFLLWRAGRYLPDHDFCIEQLRLLENDLSCISEKKYPKISPLHMYNASYGASFFAGSTLDETASCIFYFTEECSYAYALPVRKADILNKKQLFYIPLLTTLVGSFCAGGELFHPRAYSLLFRPNYFIEKLYSLFGKSSQARQDIEYLIIEMMKKAYPDLLYMSGAEKEFSGSWYNFWTNEEVASRISFQLNSSQEVIKQAALRRRYIVENAIPLNDATKKLIDDARKIYK